MLGAQCVDCGATECLEFDCIKPLGDRHHGMDTSARMCFYRKQARFGNLALRCSRCNALKSDLSLADWETYKRTVIHHVALYPQTVHPTERAAALAWMQHSNSLQRFARPPGGNTAVDPNDTEPF